MTHMCAEKEGFSKVPIRRRCSAETSLAVGLLPPQQFRQAGKTAAGLEELMRQQLVGRGTATDVNAQAHTQESLEFLAQLLGLLEARRAVGRDEVQGLEGLLVQIWWFGLDHLNRHDAQGPAVHFRTILLLLDNLGSHPVRSANHGSTLALCLGELGTEAEISCAESVPSHLNPGNNSTY